jgi:hypothetical protein
MEEVKKQTIEFPLGFWYAALPSSELKRGQMFRQMLLNRPFLLLRDKQGKVSALDDHCPHRGIPLSDGNFDGEVVENSTAQASAFIFPRCFPVRPLKSRELKQKVFLAKRQTD